MPPAPTTQPKLVPEYHDVLIVGSGVSGICMACQLKTKYGITDVKILDKLDSLAGTWKANTYPGCACDVPSAVYSFSFHQKGDWSTFFPEQEELRQYFETVASKHGLQPYFHFSTLVREARFDNDTGLWHVWTEDLPAKAKWGDKALIETEGDSAAPTAKKTHYVTKFLVSAVGGLSEPNPCDIKGHETFKGPIFHSARWDHSVQTDGKDVVVVGNGCSATQFVPVIAKGAKTVTQFVRSKHWYAPKPKNPLSFLPGWNWLVAHIPAIRYLQRFLIFCVLESHFSYTLLNPVGEFFRRKWARKCVRHAKRLAPKEYWDILIPKKDEVIVACKRRIIDETYLPCLNLPHVRLETSKLVEIGDHHVLTQDGRKIKADVIIMANGFNTQAAGYPMRVYGKDMELRDHWNKYGGGGPLNYRSSLTSGFPNMGWLMGNNSATGHNSVIFTTECQVMFLLEVAKPVLAAPRPLQEAIEHMPGTPCSEKITRSFRTPTFDVKLKAELDEQHWISKAMSKLVFSTGCGAWYLNKNSKRITALYPDWQWKFMLRAMFPQWDHFEYTGVKTTTSAAPYSAPWWKVIGYRLGVGSVPYVKPEETPEIDRKSMGA
ncbi:FAD/NAD(P)-binding domain-containing protein [Violaceomyces palustris]|uniref:FAD/NAD(P)-binding domain-containing protein n=1 Tax=Violaceomyces palustris TaxID=1673888 RepID=A0ACD0NZE4_9BASI|nr:FAD/NAD(P)-binding domain-containing protein [Violaceomyces palustris]